MLSRTRRHVARLIAIAASAAGATLLVAGPAQAHVQIIADVIPGEPATLQLNVPSELEVATTVRISVAVPPELEVTAVPRLKGWTKETVTAPGDQGTQVTWTAKPGHEIQPGESELFPLQVGPVPDQHSVALETEQTYSDGTVAAWNQPQTGGEEPEFPAPVLLIDPAAEPPDEAASEATEATEAPSATGTTESNAPAAGLLVGVGGGVLVAGIAIAVLLRRGRTPQKTT